MAHTANNCALAGIQVARYVMLGTYSLLSLSVHSGHTQVVLFKNLTHILHKF